MLLFSGSSNKPLAEKLAEALGTHLSPCEVFVFPDGERRVRVETNVLDQQVVIVQSTSTPVDTNYMELFFMVDSAKRSGAATITVVMPYVGYQRQDHVFREGEAVSLQVVIKMLESVGADRVIACDLHSIKIPEFFHVPLLHVSALSLFADTIKNSDLDLSQAFLVSPDMGGIRRIKETSEMLGNMPYVALVKNRDLATGSIETNEISGDQETIKKHAMIVDDMISSDKTIVEAAKLLKKHGVEQVDVFVTHAVFSQDAPKLLQESAVEHVYVTDSVFVPEERRFPKLKILSLSGHIAKVLEKR